MASNVSRPLLHLPQLGKPDPHEPYTGLYPDHRPRIAQEALTDELPWHCAMNILREHIGPTLAHPTDPIACQKQKIEKSFSLLIEKIRCINSNLPNITHGLDIPYVQRSLSYITKQNVLLLTNALQNISSLLSIGEDTKFESALQGFAQQDKFTDFYHYLNWLQSTSKKELYEQFLHSHNIDPKLSFEKDLQLDPELKHILHNTSWEELSDIEQSTLLNRYTFRLAAEQYGLRPSFWKPTMPLEFLTQEIETHGPLYVTGHFGLNFYLDNPYKMQSQVDGQDIYAWKPHSQEKERYLSIYAVILVGAQKTSLGQELVYFVDPNDESNPAAPQKRRVFAMSYKKLCSDISDLNLTWRNTPSDKFDYAYYGPQKALEEEAAKAQRAFLKAFPLD